MNSLTRHMKYFSVALLLLSVLPSVSTAQSEDLFRAAENGDARDVVRALDAGVSVTERREDVSFPSGINRDAVTALMVAAAHNDVSVVRVLVEAGSDISARDSNGNTALTRAAWHNEAAVVEHLLQKADEISSGVLDQSLLMAARSNSKNVVTLLVEAGANVNYSSRVGTTPLYFSAQSNSPDVVEYLLDAGADPTHKASGKTPAEAAKDHNPDVYETEVYWRLHDSQFE